jgi:hypothetical protein
VASSTGGTASFLEVAGPWVLAGSQLSFWSAEEGKQSFHYQAGASLHQGLDHALEGGKGVSPSLVFWSIETLCGQSPLPVRTFTVSIVRFSFDCFCCGQARVALLAFSGSKKGLALLSLTLADCNHQGLWWVLAHAPLLNIDGPHCWGLPSVCSAYLTVFLVSRSREKVRVCTSISSTYHLDCPEIKRCVIESSTFP